MNVDETNQATEVAGGDSNPNEYRLGRTGHMVPSSTEAIGKLFTGEKGSMPINEWLDRFETLGLAQGWDTEQKANKLIAMTSMRAYTVLRKIVVDGMAPEDKLKLFKETLLKTFGATPTQHL